MVGMMPGEARTEGFEWKEKIKILVVENFLLPLLEELKKIVFVKVIMAIWLTSWMVQTGNQTVMLLHVCGTFPIHMKFRRITIFQLEKSWGMIWIAPPSMSPSVHNLHNIVQF